MNIAVFDDVPGAHVCMTLCNARLTSTFASFDIIIKAPPHSNTMTKLHVAWAPHPSQHYIICDKISHELLRVCPDEYPKSPAGETVAERCAFMLDFVVNNATRRALDATHYVDENMF